MSYERPGIESIVYELEKCCCCGKGVGGVCGACHADIVEYGTEICSQVCIDKPDTKPLPTNAAERKATMLYTGLIKYFPDALAEVARVSVAGSKQHHPNDPVHWDRGKSDDHLDCTARHLWEAGTLDIDGQRHTAKVAWRALAALQLEIERDRDVYSKVDSQR